MSRLIDADEVVETLLCTTDVEEIFLDLAQKRRLDYLHNVEESDVVDFARDIVKAGIGVIKTSPTVDAIEVVRCNLTGNGAPSGTARVPHWATCEFAVRFRR